MKLFFLNKLVDCTKYNKIIGKAVIKKCINYFWYLNEECVVFSLFYELKSKIAKGILESNEKETEVDE